MSQNLLDRYCISILAILALGSLGHQIVSHQYNVWVYLLSCISLLWVVLQLCHISMRRLIEFCLIDTVVLILDAIAWHYGYQIRLATGADAESIYRIRHQIYQEKGYIKPQEHALLMDEYDMFASNILMIHQGEICGAMRIVYWSSIQGFPSEEYYHIDWKDEDQTTLVEVGRWVILPQYRNKTKKFPIVTVLLGLKLYLFLIRSQKKKILVTISHKLKRYIEELFQVDFEDIRELPLTNKHKKARQFFRGYFDQYKQIEACVLRLSIDELFESIGKFLRYKTQKWIHTAFSV